MMSSEIIYNAKVEEPPRRRPKPPGTDPPGSQKDVLDNSSSVNAPHLRSNSAYRDTSSENKPHQPPSNNIAKYLFGKNDRTDTIRRNRKSMEKSQLEQAMASKLNSSVNEGSVKKSEDKKSILKNGPKVTIQDHKAPKKPAEPVPVPNASTSKKELPKTKLNTSLRDSSKEGSTNKSANNKVVPVKPATYTEEEQEERLALAKRVVGFLKPQSETKKMILRTRIVNKVDEVLNRQLVGLLTSNCERLPFQRQARISMDQKRRTIEEQR